MFVLARCELWVIFFLEIECQFQFFSFQNISWGAWTRTKIKGSKGLCATITPLPNISQGIVS